MLSDDNKKINEFEKINELENVNMINCTKKLINYEKNSLLYIVFDWLKNKYQKTPIWLVGYTHKSGYEFDMENHYIMKYEYTRIISI